MKGHTMKISRTIIASMILTSTLSQAAVHEIVVEKHSFSPTSITIEVGDTIKWVSDNNRNHTVTFDPSLAEDPKNVFLPEGVKPFDLGEVNNKGDTLEYTFEVAGDYGYICVPHEDMGMVAQVTVKAP
jgi:plastocyanin